MSGTALPPTITDATVTLTFAGVQSGVSAGQYFGYCTIADVRFEFPNIAELSQIASNNTGNSRVAQEIFYAAVELQAELDQFYVMPYTGSNGNILTMLRNMNAKLTVARLLDRFYTGSETELSRAAGHYRQWVADMYHSIREGNIRWDDPFGDATSRAMNSVYDTSTASSVSPDPNDTNNPAHVPLFRVATRTRFSREGVI